MKEERKRVCAPDTTTGGGGGGGGGAPTGQERRGLGVRVDDAAGAHDALGQLGLHLDANDAPRMIQMMHPAE